MASHMVGTTLHNTTEKSSRVVVSQMMCKQQGDTIVRKNNKYTLGGKLGSTCTHMDAARLAMAVLAVSALG